MSMFFFRGYKNGTLAWKGLIHQQNNFQSYIKSYTYLPLKKSEQQLSILFPKVNVEDKDKQINQLHEKLRRVLIFQ